MKTKHILIALFFFTFNSQAQVAAITGKVVSVADGDTFTLLVNGNQQVKIRLHGIDCPEKKQDFGQVAKEFTSKKVFEKTITVKPTDIDRYGRTIAIVLLPNSISLNELLLKNGLAWHYLQYDKNPNWSKLEQSARNSKIGLWQLDQPVAPWSFRHLKRIAYKNK
nr:thermonuclease family protein [uncultured Pedobacter sp.]